MAYGYTEKILPRGYWQKGIYTILYTFVTNWNELLTKLDADTGDTTWKGDYDIQSPTIGPGAYSDIQPLAMPEGKLVALLTVIKTNFNALCDALAGDDGVAGTTIFTSQKFSTTTISHLVDVSSARIKKLGAFQDALVEFLELLQNRYGDVLSALDIDATLTDTDYYTYSLEDVVLGSSSSSSSSRSSSSSSSISSSSSSSKSSSSSSSKSSSSSSSKSSSSSSSRISSSSSSRCSSSSSRCSSSSSSSKSSSSSSSRCSSSSSSSRSSSSSSSKSSSSSSSKSSSSSRSSSSSSSSSSSTSSSSSSSSKISSSSSSSKSSSSSSSRSSSSSSRSSSSSSSSSLAIS